MKIAVCLLLILGIGSFVSGCTPYHSHGAHSGAAVGAAAGAVLDHRNPWRGGVVGGVIGAIVGATIADVSYQAGREAYQHDKPVEYYTEDRRGRYYAEPRGYNERTKCRKIREKVWEDGRLVKDEEREICEGQKHERRY